MERQRKQGADVTSISREHLREVHLTLRPMPNERPAMMLWRLEALLREHDATVVRIEVFGQVAAHEETAARIRKLLREPDLPILCLEGRGPANPVIAGIHVFAIGDATVEPLVVDGATVGRVVDDGATRHVLLGDVAPANCSASRADQTRSLFDRVEKCVGAAGMSMHNVVRTWMFLDDILDWYGLFNAVRTEFFKSHKVLNHLVPASTGVGVKNIHNAALVCGVWAVDQKQSSISVRELGSPLQCPAPQYGSSFSRAIEMLTPEYRRVLISGTASIHGGGATARVDDVRGQIDLTMDVVQAILSANALTLTAATRATAYFKDIAHAPLFEDWCRQKGLLRLPCVSVQADGCRDDLLFQLELDAVAQIAPKIERRRRNEKD